MTAIRRLYDKQDMIRASHTGDDSIGRNAVFQYEQVFRKGRHLCCLGDEKNKEVVTNDFALTATEVVDSAAVL